MYVSLQVRRLQKKKYDYRGVVFLKKFGLLLKNDNKTTQLQEHNKALRK